MKIEKWTIDGEEVEIPIVSDEEIEKNNFNSVNLENTMEIDENEFVEENDTIN